LTEKLESFLDGLDSAIRVGGEARAFGVFCAGSHGRAGGHRKTRTFGDVDAWMAPFARAVLRQPLARGDAGHRRSDAPVSPSQGRRRPMPSSTGRRSAFARIVGVRCAKSLRLARPGRFRCLTGAMSPLSPPETPWPSRVEGDFAAPPADDSGFAGQIDGASSFRVAAGRMAWTKGVGAVTVHSD
jgi:hypothetical protein